MIKGARRVKDLIRNKAKGDSGKAQSLLRHFAMERFLERVSISQYKDNLILKGGMLMSSLVGIDNRSTMDIDTTLKGVPLSVDDVLAMVQRIAEVDIDDGVTFSIKDGEEIMEDSEYGGVRVSMVAHMERTVIPMKIDISTGDAITPEETLHGYKLMFEERIIDIWAYPIETVLSEKIETALARGVVNTRMRDYYDIYMLLESERDIDSKTLRAAIAATATTRGHDVGKENYSSILSDIGSNNVMAERWNSYANSHEYSDSIEWESVLNALRELCDACWNESIERL